ncbi:MAG: ribosome-associated translation inhibitor RaiA [Oscillospiraceae bacterium]|nr:ribosome-associated translation inhibitor RaiA [Oscillospiraceae bacterium]MDD3832504.1 ribosome-associated translation inhibitor RaiA [Oscillospiraceae bacterium]
MGDESMKITITGRKVPIGELFTQRTEKKMSKLDKFFDSDAQAEVTVSQERNMQRVEITIRHNGMLFRAEDAAREANDVVDKLVDILFRQIRRNKTRLEKRLRDDAFLDNGVGMDAEETEFNIVRSKKFNVKPMDVEEAVLQMNLLGHQFYMFRNMHTDEINVVYCRRDGNYGLLEPNL